MKKKIKKKFDSYIELQLKALDSGIITKAGFLNRLYGVLKGLEFAGVITEEELTKLYLEITKIIRGI